MFGPKPYDRAEVLAEAEKARGKRNRKKAIAGYRRILEHEPDDFVVHGKLAPLMVDDEPGAAWASFEKAAHGHSAKGFSDRALAVYRQAADALPFIAEAWEHVEGRARVVVEGVPVDGERPLLARRPGREVGGAAAALPAPALMASTRLRIDARAVESTDLRLKLSATSRCWGSALARFTCRYPR